MDEPKPVFSKPLFDKIAVEKRNSLLSAAVEEFAEKGLSLANVNTIAGRAGISVGSIYKYFNSKEDLYLAVVQLGYDRLDEALTPILDSGKGFGEKLTLILDALFEHSKKYESLTRLYNRFTSEGNAALAARLADRLESFTARRYADLLREAVAAGLIPGGIDERMLAFCMDNVLLVMQFSLTGEYYRDRMRIYLGDGLAGDEARLKEQLLLFMRRALGMGAA